MAGRGWVGLALAAGLLAVDAYAMDRARPGGVVGWAGEPASECRQDGHVFPPIDGICYFAVDLQATGSVMAERRTSRGIERRRLQIGAYPYRTQSLHGVEPKFVTPSEADLARIKVEQAEVSHLWDLATPRRFELPLTPPVEPLPTACGFGVRRIVNGEPRSPHAGCDYPAPSGTPVLAPADGTVALAADQFFAGGAVYLDHGDGLASMAFHLSEILVKPGQAVTRGQVIGKVGASGLATGPHLHFGLRWRGARIDPALLLGRPEAIPLLGSRPVSRPKAQRPSR